MDNYKTDQDRKSDIMYMMKKGNIVLNDISDSDQGKQGGPLFNNMNMPNQWFWSKKSVKITHNNTFMSNEHITNIIKYIAPLPFHASMYCDIDTTNEYTYKIFTLADVKIYKETSEKDKMSLLEHHPYKNYYLFKVPPGKKISFTAETEFNKPYVCTSEYDVDAQQEIKEILLFDIVDKWLLKGNQKQQFVYVNQDLDKRNVNNTFMLTSNNAAKFRRPHIVPILPPYYDNKRLYSLAGITETSLKEYFQRLHNENELSFIKENSDNHIIIGFSIVGSSLYCPRFLEVAFINLRRNISNFTFLDKDFILQLVSAIISKIESFDHSSSHN